MYFKRSKRVVGNINSTIDRDAFEMQRWSEESFKSQRIAEIISEEITELVKRELKDRTVNRISKYLLAYRCPFFKYFMPA